jgi:NAD(P)-dependent dehydrogenase (short-subunit alcohol dehydrogenase family)
MAISDKFMQEKVCMVTGATSGMDEVTARALAQRGATTIIVGRNPEKSAATVNRIKEQTDNPEVEFMLADLSSQEEIRQLAQQFKSRHHRLDVLVNNAGAWITRRQQSVDGIEMTFALNHLNYFLLTNLLLDTLKVSAPARIINVSSGGHKRGRIDFDDLQAKERYNGIQVYGQSKLANVLFTYELARRLVGTGVTVNAVNPGFVASNFGRNNGGVMVLLMRLYYSVAAISPEQGAQTSIYLATSADVEGVTGKYFEKQIAVPSSEDSYDTVAANRLWQVSAELTGLALSAG